MEELKKLIKHVESMQDEIERRKNYLEEGTIYLSHTRLSTIQPNCEFLRDVRSAIQKEIDRLESELAPIKSKLETINDLLK